MKKLHHDSASHPEVRPEADIVCDLAGMKRLGLNAARIGEFTWSKPEPDEGRISLDFFVRVRDRLHGAGHGAVFHGCGGPRHVARLAAARHARAPGGVGRLAAHR